MSANSPELNPDQTRQDHSGRVVSIHPQPQDTELAEELRLDGLPCPQCRWNNPEHSRFCNHCGVSLTELPVTPAQQNTKRQSALGITSAVIALVGAVMFFGSTATALIMPEEVFVEWWGLLALSAFLIAVVSFCGMGVGLAGFFQRNRSWVWPYVGLTLNAAMAIMMVLGLLGSLIYWIYQEDATLEEEEYRFVKTGQQEMRTATVPAHTASTVEKAV